MKYTITSLEEFKLDLKKDYEDLQNLLKLLENQFEDLLKFEFKPECACKKAHFSCLITDTIFEENNLVDEYLDENKINGPDFQYLDRFRALQHEIVKKLTDLIVK